MALSAEKDLPARENSLLPVVALLGILVIFGAVVLSLHASAFAVTDCDTLAFLRTARGLATRGDPSQRTSDPFELVGEQMVEAREGVFYSKYPIGYPLLCAAAYVVGGPSAPFLVNPLLGILSIVGIYLLAKSLSGSRAVGAWAALVLATNPLHLMYALSTVGHTASVCMATWGMLFLWRWARPDGGGLANAALASGLIGFTTTVRYPDALLLLPLAVLAAWRLRASGASRQVMSELLVMALAVLLALAPQLAYQWFAFGSPWTTGYAASQESTAFGWSWFVQHAPWIIQHLLGMGLLPLFVIGTLGLVYLCTVDARQALLLGLWGLPLFLLYCSYYFVTEDQPISNLRYYLTVLPAFIVSALMIAFRVPRSRWVTGLLVGLCLLPGVPLIGGAIAGGDSDSFDPAVAASDVSEQVRTTVPDGAVILSLDRMLYFLDYGERYRLYYLGILTEGYRQWAAGILAGDGPSPFQRPRLAKIVELLNDKSAGDLANMQLAIATRHLAEGRAVMLITMSPPNDDVRPFHNVALFPGDVPVVNDQGPDSLRPFRNSLRVRKVHEFPFGGAQGSGGAPESSSRPMQTVEIYALEDVSS